nr:unnamed protein product [Digitaria exilis]
MSVVAARRLRAGGGGGRTAHHRGGAQPRPTREERFRRQPRSRCSSASQAAKRVLPPATALDQINPVDRTEDSDEPGLTSSFVPETIRNPRIPRAEKPQSRKSTTRRPPKTPPQISTHTRNSNGRTRSGAHLARIWAESRSRGHPSDARGELQPPPPMKAPSDEAGSDEPAPEVVEPRRRG